MRKVFDFQMKLGEIAIGDIKFDLRARDEITKLLIGFQSIFCNRELRTKIFEVLMELIPKDIDLKNGREGMVLWRIFVLGTLRLNCNWDYDKVLEMANNHRNLRLMLCHCDFSEQYALQTIKDNISLFAPEISSKISRLVIEYGHLAAGKKPEDALKGSCDSVPVETNVHFPTDISLLWDAMRKMITLIMTLTVALGLTGWREGISILYKVKGAFRKVQILKQSNSQNEQAREEKSRQIVNAHRSYLELAELILRKIGQTLLSVSSTDESVIRKIAEIQMYIVHAERQIDQIRRRVEQGETIPHHEKVFSIFEEHTEWIKKGKAGVPVELGLNVCIVKDQFGFILHHRVMQNETDDKVAVPIITETTARFPSLKSCSFDKGFHSPENQEKLSELLEKVILPRKGKLSAINAEVENSEEFKHARRKHSAVESSINALENHGLDRCPDHGIEGFKVYIGLAVLARNIQILGHILQQKELKRQQRSNIRQREKCALLL